MRHLNRALVLPLLIAPTVQAQPAIRIDFIKCPEVEVRAGPSSQYAVTGLLRKNARIFVKGPAGQSGFLEIMPPPGSVSWVRSVVVTKVGLPDPTTGRQAFYISGDQRDPEVPVRPGGLSIQDGPLPIELYKAKRGTQGYIRGNLVVSKDDDSKWYPIDPLPGESRYIPVEALQEGAVMARDQSGPASGQLTSLPPKNTRELFDRARRADEAGNIDEAIELYQQVSREVSASDDATANYCATRVYELRRRRATSGTLTARRPDPNDAGNAGPPEPPLPGAGSRQPSPPASTPAPPANFRASGIGYLRRTSFTIDSRTSYALVDRAGRVVFYVTAEPGLSLEPYVERWVDLHGFIEVRGDVRGAEYMRVVRVYLHR